MSNSVSTINIIATASTKSILKIRQELEKTSEGNLQIASKNPSKAKVTFNLQVKELDQTKPLRETEESKVKYTPVDTKPQAVINVDNISTLGSLESISNVLTDSADTSLLNTRSSTSEHSANLIEDWKEDVRSISTTSLAKKLTSDQLENVKINKFDSLVEGSSDVSSKYRVEVPGRTNVVKSTSFLEKLDAFSKRLEDIERSLENDGTTIRNELEITKSVPVKQESHTLLSETAAVLDQGKPMNDNDVSGPCGKLIQDCTVGLLTIEFKPVSKLSEDILGLEEVIPVRNNNTSALDVVQFENSITLDDPSDSSLTLRSEEHFDITDNSETTEYFSLDYSEDAEEATSFLEQEPSHQLPKNIKLKKEWVPELSSYFANKYKEGFQIAVKVSTETEREADNSFFDKCIAQNENQLIQPENQDSKRNSFKDTDSNENTLQLIPTSSLLKNLQPSKKILHSGHMLEKMIENGEHLLSLVDSISNLYLRSGDRILCYSTELFPSLHFESDRKSTQIVKSLEVLAIENYKQQKCQIRDIKACASQTNLKASEETQEETLIQSLKATTGTSCDKENETVIIQGTTLTGNECKAEGETIKTQGNTVAKVSETTIYVFSENQCKAVGETAKTRDNTLTELLKSFISSSSKNQLKPYSKTLETQSNTLRIRLKPAITTTSGHQCKSERETVKRQYSTFIKPLKSTVRTSPGIENKPKSVCLYSVNRGLTSKINVESIHQLKKCAGTTKTNISKIKPGPEEDLLEATKVHKDISLKSLALDLSSSEVHGGIKNKKCSDRVILNSQQVKQEPNAKSSENVRKKVSCSSKEELVKKYQKLAGLGAKASFETKKCLKNWSTQKDVLGKKGFVTKRPVVTAVAKLKTINEAAENSGSKFETKSSNKQQLLAKSVTRDNLQHEQHIEERSFKETNLRISTPSKLEEKPVKPQKKVVKATAQNSKAVTSRPKKDLTVLLKELAKVLSKSVLHIKEKAKNINKVPKGTAAKDKAKNILKSPVEANSGANNRTITKRSNQKLGSSERKAVTIQGEFSYFSKIRKNISLHRKDKPTDSPKSQEKSSEMSRVLGSPKSKTKLKRRTGYDAQDSTESVSKASRSIKNKKISKINTSKRRQQLGIVRKKISSVESQSSSYGSKPKKITTPLPERPIGYSK